jgi:hypothetical protein
MGLSAVVRFVIFWLLELRKKRTGKMMGRIEPKKPTSGGSLSRGAERALH